MTQTFVKRPNEHRAAEAEAAGLRWLADASECVPAVVSLNAERNELETAYVESAAPTPEVARRAADST